MRLFVTWTNLKVHFPAALSHQQPLSSSATALDKEACFIMIKQTFLRVHDDSNDVRYVVSLLALSLKTKRKERKWQQIESELQGTCIPSDDAWDIN